MASASPVDSAVEFTEYKSPHGDSTSLTLSSAAASDADDKRAYADVVGYDPVAATRRCQIQYDWPLHFVVQLYYLTAKNLRHCYRQRTNTLILCLIPTVAVLLLWTIDAIDQREAKSAAAASTATPSLATFSPSYRPCQVLDVFGQVSIDSETCTSIMYAPSTPLTDSIMRDVASSLSLSFSTTDPTADVVPQSTVAQLQHFVGTNLGAVDTAVIFETLQPNGYTPLSPVQMRYTIRYNASSYGEMSLTSSVGYPQQPLLLWRTVVFNRVTTLQYVLEAVMVNALSLNITRQYPPPGVVPASTPLSYPLQQPLNELYQRQYFAPPIPPTPTNPSTAQSSIIPVVPSYAGGGFFVAAAAAMAAIFLQNITKEKRRGILALLRANGLIEATFWLSYFINFSLIGFVAAFIAISVAQGTGMDIFVRVSWGVHFVALWMLITAFGGIAVLISVFFSRPRWIGLVSFFFVCFVVVTTVIILLATNGDPNSVYARVAINRSTGAFQTQSTPGYVNFISIAPWFHYLKIWADTDRNSRYQYVTNQTLFQNVTFNMTEYSIYVDYNSRIPGKSYAMYVPLTYSWADSQYPQMYQNKQNYYTDNPCNLFDHHCCHVVATTWIYNFGFYYPPVVACTYYVSSGGAMGLIFLMGILNVIVAWFFAQVGSITVGGNRPFYFILLPSYWNCCYKRTRDDAEGRTVMTGDSLKAERLLSLKDGGVRTLRLSKTYPSTGHGVREVTLTANRNEVYALLGSNGCGKSTLLSVLSGQLPLTYGDAFINGYSIRSEMAAISQSGMLGICMQSNVLWPNQTVLEHMRLFAAVRQVKWSNRESAITSLLHDVSLWDDRYKFVNQLSGGMKRRLSIAMALLGSPSVLFLDEPTAGTDPLHRHDVWNVIKRIKANRTIILTTHDLVEAEILADNVGIMYSGRLRAAGPTSTLVNKFGRGYELQMLVDTKRTAALKSAVNRIIPAAHVTCLESGLVSIEMKRSQLRHIPALFQWNQESGLAIATATATATAAATAIAAVSPDENDKGDGGDKPTKKVEDGGLKPNDTRLKQWSIGLSSLEAVFLRLSESESSVNGELLEGESEAVIPMCLVCNIRRAEIVILYTPTNVPLTVPNLFCRQCGQSGRPPSDEERAAVEIEEKKRADDQAATDAALDESPLVFEVSNDTTRSKPKPVADKSADTSVVEVVPKRVKAPPRKAATGSWLHFYAQVRAIWLRNVTIVFSERRAWLARIIILIILAISLIRLSQVQLALSVTKCPTGGFDKGSYSKTDICTDQTALTQYLFLPTYFGYDSGQTGLDWPYSTASRAYLPTVLSGSVAIMNSPVIGDLSFGNVDTGPIIIEAFMDWTVNQTAITPTVKDGEQARLQFIRNATNAYQACPFVYPSSSADSTGFFINGSIAVASSYLSNSFPASGLDILRLSIPNDTVQSLTSPITFGYHLTSYFDTRSYGVSGSITFPTIYYYTSGIGCSSYTLTLSPSIAYIPNVIHHLSYSALWTAIRRRSSYVQQSSYNISVPNTYWNGSTYVTYYTYSMSDPRLNVSAPAIMGTINALNLLYFSSADTSQTFAISIGILTTMGVWLLPYYIDRIAYEREERLFEMMTFAGVSVLNYWFITYLFDLCLTFSFMIFLIILGFGFNLDEFTNTDFGLWFLITLVWSHSAEGVVWCFAAFYRKRTHAAIYAYLLCGLIIILGVANEFFTGSSNDFYYPDSASIFPPFGFVQCLSLVFRYGSGGRILTASRGSFGYAIGLQFAMGTVMLVVGAYVNTFRNRRDDYIAPKVRAAMYSALRYTLQSLRLSAHLPNPNQDALVVIKPDQEETVGKDVQDEAARVAAYVRSLDQHNADAAKSNIIAVALYDLCQSYGRKKSALALNHVSLGINKGECIGLIGPNGSGKSSALSILSGLNTQSSGKVYIHGRPADAVMTTAREAGAVIGYCPQDDILYEDLTVRHHLLLYTRLNGIWSRPQERAIVQTIADSVSLSGDSFDKAVNKLSGGQKRRLSLAISLIAEPSVWLLDEPTTGMSPEVRHEVWEIISKARHDYPQRSIVLASHSLTEVQSLSDRVALLSNGSVQCVGPNAELIRRFGGGFRLTLVMQPGADIAAAVGAAHAASRQHWRSENDISVSQSQKQDASVNNQRPLLTAVIAAAIAPSTLRLLSTSNNRIEFAITASVDNEPVKISGDVRCDDSATMRAMLSLFTALDGARKALQQDYGVAHFQIHAATLDDVFNAVVKATQQVDKKHHHDDQDDDE